MNWTKGWAAPSRSDPVLELLEDRRLFAVQPVVTFDGGDATLIGETARITVTLSSVPDGSRGSDAGYSPDIDLILLTEGADGGTSDANLAQIKDGDAFQRAPLNGQFTQATQTEIDSSSTTIHPFARDQNRDLRVVGAGDYGAQARDTLVVPCLPFGPYAPSQPAAPIRVTFGASPQTDLNVPRSVSAARPFAFGRDALNNSMQDAPALGSAANNAIAPALFTVNKTSDLAESETALGPSFPHRRTVTLDIAYRRTIDSHAWRTCRRAEAPSPVRRPLRRLWRRQLQRHAERHGNTDRFSGRRRESVNRRLVLASQCRCLRCRAHQSQVTP
ncbi:hypothetical protein ACWIEX_00130 [Bosea sp. NPDC055353]